MSPENDALYEVPPGAEPPNPRDLLVDQLTRIACDLERVLRAVWVACGLLLVLALLVLLRVLQA